MAMTAGQAKELAIKNGSLTKQICIAAVIEIEGGYVNDPTDAGGETKYGITVEKAKEHQSALISKFKWNGKVIDLTYDMAVYIYDTDFWSNLRLDAVIQIHPLIAERLFDIAVNCGVNRAGAWFKRALNALNQQGKFYPNLDVTSGFVGDQTIRALMTLKQSRGMIALNTIPRTLYALQGNHYIEYVEKVESQEKYFMGWMTRMKLYNGT